MTFVLSDSSSVNSYGFRIDLQGMDLTRFRTNPVMLYQHDQTKVIGCWSNVRIDGSRLLADAVFDEQDALAIEVQRKVADGFLKGCSVGIRIDRMAENPDGTMTALRSELVEASIVAVPADAKAGVVLYNNEYQCLGTDSDALAMLQLLTNNTTRMTSEELNERLQAAEERVQQLEAQVVTLQQNNDQLATLQQQVEQLTARMEEHAPKTTSLAAQLRHGAQAANNERTGWTFLKWAKEDPEGLALMRNERPDEYKALTEA